LRSRNCCTAFGEVGFVRIVHNLVLTRVRSDLS